MDRDRRSLICGFMPAAAMLCLLLVRELVSRGQLEWGVQTAVGAELAAFFIPFALLAVLLRRGKEKVKLRLRGFSVRALPFILFLSIATCFFTLLINSLLAVEGGAEQLSSGALLGVGEQDADVVFLIIAVMPAIVEELFFRSGFLGGMEENGTLAAILASAFAFALVHGNPINFVGPFVAGCVYGYMTCALGSVWAAMMAHLCNNSAYLLIQRLMESYSAFGLWRYFIIFSIIMLCLFLYLAMRSLEKMIERGRIPRFRPGSLQKTLSALILSPGLWIMTVVFVLRAVKVI